ncbi:MAG: tRNA (N(6)-L-threonylcarbamoyladenosine(37)-C(2))-methylthiotransferase MtaB [Flavobacteriales bacterium]
MNDVKNIAFYTLGCKLNYSESDTIARSFDRKSFKRVPFGHPADIYVINTCSVTHIADSKCRNAIKRAKRQNPDAFVIATGCYTQLNNDAVSCMEDIDLVVDANQKLDIAKIYRQRQKSKEKPVNGKAVINRIRSCDGFKPAFSLDERTRSFLKIQDGCDYFCTYCTIPMARGVSRSATIEDIVKTSVYLAGQGVHEVVLSGVNVGEFGVRNGESLSELLCELIKVKGIDRYRISSIEPNLLTSGIIKMVADSGKLARHFHIPMQSGSDEILKLMRRKYVTAFYRAKIEEIHEKVPGACIGADVITGFPGETDIHFRETYEFIEQLKLSYLHVFPYSERPNTGAVKSPAKVPVPVRRKRADALRALSERMKKDFYSSQKGSRGIVLFESSLKAGSMFGFTDNYVKVKIPASAALINHMVEVDLIDLEEDGTMRANLVNRDYSEQL